MLEAAVVLGEIGEREAVALGAAGEAEGVKDFGFGIAGIVVCAHRSNPAIVMPATAVPQRRIEPGSARAPAIVGGGDPQARRLAPAAALPGAQWMRSRPTICSASRGAKKYG